MKFSLALLALLFSVFAQAAIETYDFSNSADEERYKDLIAELRCLVCQNQNLADSNAELAQDLRREVYEMIARGDTDEQITAFMVQRYGDFVLYRPPFKTSTAFLWVGPFIILLAGLGILYMVVRKRKAAAVVADGELNRARSLLDDEQGEGQDDNKKSS
ncbi:MAG: cytochrome c-type biogenesis protein [Gammaproteobacteria bacterium]